MIVGIASTSLLATVQERTSPALEDPTCALKRSVEIEPKNIQSRKLNFFYHYFIKCTLKDTVCIHFVIDSLSEIRILDLYPR